MADSTNPGVVEVENQGFPLAAPPPPAVTSPAASAAPFTQGGNFNPMTTNAIDVTQNNVITQPGPQFISTISVNV